MWMNSWFQWWFRLEAVYFYKPFTQTALYVRESLLIGVDDFECKCRGGRRRRRHSPTTEKKCASASYNEKWAGKGEQHNDQEFRDMKNTYTRRNHGRQ